MAHVNQKVAVQMRERKMMRNCCALVHNHDCRKRCQNIFQTCSNILFDKQDFNKRAILGPLAPFEETLVTFKSHFQCIFDFLLYFNKFIHSFVLTFRKN